MCASATMASLKFPLQDPPQAAATAATTTPPQFPANWSSQNRRVSPTRRTDPCVGSTLEEGIGFAPIEDPCVRSTWSVSPQEEFGVCRRQQDKKKKIGVCRRLNVCRSEEDTVCVTD